MRPETYLAEHAAPPVIGTSEVARVLGVSIDRVKQLRKTHDFPPPALRLTMGDLWWTADIEAWAAVNAERRALRDPRKRKTPTTTTTGAKA